MGLPITTTEGGICFAFPDVCKTPIGTSEVPIPYPNIGLLSEAEDASTDVRVAGHPVILENSEIKKTMGDEAGTGGPGPGERVTFTSASASVRINGEFVVRMTDKTSQNNGNAKGVVLGGVANVRCG
ncbi:MAG: DUF4150 domain-containing protein [bacterium]